MEPEEMTGGASGRHQSDQVITVGVVADTHVPDRVWDIHPALLSGLRAAGVSHIMHTGDISLPWVLDSLRQVAPVYAVRGNRDIFAGPLPLEQQIPIGGISILLLHGHGGFFPYLRDKIYFLLFGYDLQRYLKLLRKSGPERAIVFGHTHHPEIIWKKGRLLFNPGSATIGYYAEDRPSFGLLKISPDQTVQAEIVPLKGYKIRRHRWVKTVE